MIINCNLGCECEYFTSFCNTRAAYIYFSPFVCTRCILLRNTYKFWNEFLCYMIISVKILNYRWSTQNIKYLFFQIQCCTKVLKSVTNVQHLVSGRNLQQSICGLNDVSDSVRSRDNSIDVLPRLRSGILGSIFGVTKISFLSKKNSNWIWAQVVAYSMDAEGSF